MLRNPCFQLGRNSYTPMGEEEYNDSQVQSLIDEINSLKNKLENEKVLYAQIKSKLVNEIEDLPKLSPYERAQYKNLYNSIQRTQRIILEKEPMIKVMREASKPWLQQPTLDDVMNYSLEKNLPPSQAVDEYEKEYAYVFYPPIAHAKADQINRDFTRIMDNSVPVKPLYGFRWLDQAIEWLDKEHGKGETPYLDRVLENRLNFIIMKNAIKNYEKAYLLDTVNDFLGRPTTTFTPNMISAITSSSTKLSDIPKPVSKKFHFSGDYDGTMGFSLKSLVKSVTSVALSPIQRLVVSPFNKVISSVVAPVLKTVLPDNLVNALANLSEAQANILAGKISSNNIRQAVKASVVVAGYATGPSAYVAKEQIKLVKKTAIGNSLDKYSGGLLTSAQNLSQMSSDAQAGRKIDVTARAIDGLKIGLAVSGGAGALAATVGTNYAANETPLKNLPMSNTLTKGALALSTGQGLTEVATDMAKEKAISTGVKVGVSSGLVNQSQGNILSSVATSMSQGNSAETALFNTSKSVGISKAKSLAVNSGLVSNSMVNLVEKGLTADLENADMSSLAQAEANRYVSRQVANQLDKHGVNLDKINSLSQGDLSSLQQTVSKMEKTDFQEYVKDQQEELQNKFDSERLNLEKKMNDTAIQYQNEYSRLYRNYTSPELERQIEALQKKYSDIASQYVAHLENQLAIIQKDFTEGLNKVSKEISKFDPKAMIDEAIAKAKNAMSNTNSLFEFNAYDKMYNLVKKYGKDFLLYLLYKYGSQADYDSLITEEDKEAYKTWEPNGIQIKKKSSVAPLIIGAGIIGAFMMIVGGSGE